MTMKRRNFLQLAATASTALGLGFNVQADETSKIRTAVVGCGRQGRALINAGLKIPNLRFTALCDIQPTALKSARLYLEAEDVETNAYTDFNELVSKEKNNVDAVIIATPDFAHTEQALTALDSGWNVYCEALLATNTVDAEKIIQKSQQTKRFVQVGFERRSDPRYRHMVEKLLNAEQQEKLLGTITHLETQANRKIHSELIWSKKDTLDETYLKKYGYDSMSQYRNWKEYKQYSNGVCALYLAQQLDVFHWLFGVESAEVKASGGHDYYSFGDCPDNVEALLNYKISGKNVRSVSQVRTTTSGGGNVPVESVYGTAGSLTASLSADAFRVFAEPGLAKWSEFVSSGLLKKETVAADGEDPNVINVKETGKVVPYLLPVIRPDSVFRLHLENFINAVLGKEPLHCSAADALPAHQIAWKICNTL